MNKRFSVVLVYLFFLMVSALANASNDVSCNSENPTSSHLPELFIYGADKKTYALKQTDEAIQDLLQVSEDH